MAAKHEGLVEFIRHRLNADRIEAVCLAHDEPRWLRTIDDSKLPVWMEGS